MVVFNITIRMRILTFSQAVLTFTATSLKSSKMSKFNVFFEMAIDGKSVGRVTMEVCTPDCIDLKNFPDYFSLY